ncbi:hypothetical protein NBRC116593_24910 [Sulfitobacter pacificus]
MCCTSCLTLKTSHAPACLTAFNVMFDPAPQLRMAERRKCERPDQMTGPLNALTVLLTAVVACT